MASRIATFVLSAAALLGRPAAASPGDSPNPPGDPEAPIPIFLNAPADLDSFWMMLSRPDFVVLDGDLYRKLVQAGEPPRVAKAPSPATVESVTIAGPVAGDLARLAIEFRMSMASEGPHWVPIHLDGLTLSGASDGSGDLATRIAEGRGWLVELKGRGEHLVRVDLLAPVRQTADGRRIELAVPPAPSTRVDLVLPRPVTDASAGPGEEVLPSKVGEGAAVRLSARLSPRSRVELAWREGGDPASKLPPLLSAQGEISLEIERGSIRSRGTWVVGSIRGTSSLLNLRLDSAEEVLDLEVDNKPVQVEARREGGRSVVSIPLAEPLRPGSTRAILLHTRRPIASSGTARVALQGYSFDQAKVQTGVIAIARSGPLFVNPNPGRGLRRIDPRTELPESLRGRPDTTLAFEFNDQPFELSLGIEPAPPRVRVESRTTVTVAPRSARLETRLDGRATQGKVFELKVAIPKGLEFDGAGPPEAVESTQVIPLDARPSPGGDGEMPRVVVVTLAPQARESDSFAITLKGSAAIDPSEVVRLPTFQPLVDTNAGGRLAVVSDRNVSVEPGPAAEEPPSFRVDWASPPADWPWPDRRPGPDQGLLWLRADANPPSIPLKVTVRARSIRHESTLNVAIDRAGAEVVDEIAGEVSFGTLPRLDVALPAEVPARWEVEGVELAGRELLGQDPGGVRRYRLRFAREFVDAFRLRVRYHLPFAGSPGSEGGGRLRLGPIRPLEGTSTGRRVLVSAEADFDLEPEAKGWDASAGPGPPPAPGGRPARLALSAADERPGPVEVRVRVGPRSSLPGVVASRLWIRTVQRAEDDLDTSARLWVESSEGSLRVGLPPRSRWVRARVGGAELAEGDVEQVAGDDYRIRFPAATPAGPVLVSVDFVVPAASTSGGWPTIRLLDGGIIQQTAWEARVLASRAGVGTPAGWLDENEWSWEGYLWKRRPWKSPLEMSNWLTGGSSRYRLDEPLQPVELAGHQGYLFSRVGPPTRLRFAIFSRLTLLVLCSGPVLAAGLLVLARRPPPRWAAALLLILAFAAGSLVEPSVLFLALQSSALGVVLWLSAVAMNWAIERPGRRRHAGQGALIVPAAPAGSSMARPSPPGSDDSTAIRSRPATPPAASTADHVVLVRGFPPGVASPSDRESR